MKLPSEEMGAVVVGNHLVTWSIYNRNPPFASIYDSRTFDTIGHLCRGHWMIWVSDGKELAVELSSLTFEDAVRELTRVKWAYQKMSE